MTAPIYRESEGQHSFPGVLAEESGEEFFTSDCAYGCGAWMSRMASAPAKDRRDTRYMSAYGDSRGVGTCPNASTPVASTTVAPVARAVTLEQIAEQCALGWRDFHPEAYCHRCGQRNVKSWAAPNTLWAEAKAATPDWPASDIVCPQCFTEALEATRGHYDTFWVSTFDPEASEGGS